VDNVIEDRKSDLEMRAPLKPSFEMIWPPPAQPATGQQGGPKMIDVSPLDCCNDQTY